MSQPFSKPQLQPSETHTIDLRRGGRIEMGVNTRFNIVQWEQTDISHMDGKSLGAVIRVMWNGYTQDGQVVKYAQVYDFDHHAREVGDLLEEERMSVMKRNALNAGP